MNASTQARSKPQLTVAGILLALWAAAAWFFYAPTTPLSQAEIDAYMVDVQNLLEVSFVMPEGVGLDPRGLAGAMSDLRKLAERDDGKPIYMVNLMKWREGDLSFPAAAELADFIKTAEEADLAYNKALFWELLANNRHTAYLASVEPNTFNYGTSPEADGWGEIGIFRYNSRRDFFNMVTSDSYRNILYLKMVSMGGIAIAPSQPHGLFSDVKAPAWLKRWKIRQRQKSNFVDKDGVTADNREHVEQGYLRVLGTLESIFQQRPFFFGDRPTLADFGLFGPMFRHFSQDPTPAQIMRETAPGVFEWVGRMWNARASQLSGELVSGIPGDILPLLQEIGATHLLNLAANTQAWREHKKHYDVTIQGAHYTRLPVCRYRSWCLEQLQNHCKQLPPGTRDSLQQLLEANCCWQPLWQIPETRSMYDPGQRAPFGVGLKVYPVQGA